MNYASMQKFGAYNRVGLDESMGVHFDPEIEKAMKEEAKKPWWEEWVKSLEKVGEKLESKDYVDKLKAEVAIKTGGKTFHPSQPAYPAAKKIGMAYIPPKKTTNYVPYFVIGGLGILGTLLILRK